MIQKSLTSINESTAPLEHTMFVYAYHTWFSKPNAPLINIKIAYDTAIANLGSIVHLTRGAFE